MKNFLCIKHKLCRNGGWCVSECSFKKFYINFSYIMEHNIILLYYFVSSIFKLIIK